MRVEHRVTLRHVADPGACEIFERTARDLLAVEHDLAAGHPHKAEDRLQQRGLARAVRAYHDNELPALHLDVDTVDDRDVAVACDKTVGRET